jgi:peptide/nickel transport system permease protein
MLRYILRRLLWVIPTIILVTFVVYIAIRVGWKPEQSYQRANPRASKEKIQQFKDVNGLYDGVGGWVKGYFKWAWQFIQGPDKWPRSIRGRALVYPLLRYSIFNTLRLAGVATILGVVIGLLLGVVASLRPGGMVDSVINTGAFILGSFQPFVSGVILQLVFAVSLGWLPPVGVYPPGQKGFDLWLMVKHMILPVSVVAIQIVTGYSRYMRAALLDVRSGDYLRTARAKGVSEFRVLFRHAVRNALIPIVTVLAIDMGSILGGLIITEAIFNYPGLGVYFVKAQTNGDFPQLMPYLVLVVVSVLIFNLIADISYAWLDPRIRLD